MVIPRKLLNPWTSYLVSRYNTRSDICLMTSAFLTLTKCPGHTTRSKVIDVKVSAFSECFLFPLTLLKQNHTTTKKPRSIQILCTTDSNRAALGHLIVLVQNEKISISQFLLIRTCLLSTKYCLIERSVKNLDSFLCLMHRIAVCKLTSFNKIYLNIKCANGVYNSDLHKSHDIFTFLGNIVGHFMSNKIFQHITYRSTNTETGSLILYNRKRVTYIVTSYCIMYTVYLTISVQIFKITI